jgi:protein-tyrosine phosphatase
VCTGNICRSPIAERMTRQGLAWRLGDEARRFVVDSAGTWGHEGAPMEPHAAQTLLTYGGDPEGFRGRELLHEHVEAADIVLTAAREHREHVLALEPGAIRRVFTLKEFTRLAGAVDDSRLPAYDIVERSRALVREAATLRRRVRARRPADDDVADPYGAPMYAYRTCAAEIAAALGPILTTMAGTRVA